MLSSSQIKYIELEKKKDSYRKFLEELKEATQAVVNEVGVGGHFQDADGTVYQIEESEGKFVYFDRFEIKRTRRSGEKSGTLSLTKAKELGYEVV
jgi:hypothetical protein